MKQSKLLKLVPNIEHGFTDRSTAKDIIYALEHSVSVGRQVHGNAVLWLTEPLPPPAIKFPERPEVDALMTPEKNLSIGVLSADCCPILLCAVNNQHQAQVVAAVHAGWRGTVAKIAENALRSLQRHSTFSKILAAIGPTISKEKFEVGEEVAKLFLPEEKVFYRMENNTAKYLVDLPAANIRQLTEYAKAHKLNLEIDNIAECTLTNSLLYPSYRRKDSHGERIISFICIT